MGWMQEFIKKEMADRLDRPLDTYGITGGRLTKRPFKDSTDYVYLTLEVTRKDLPTVVGEINVSRAALEESYGSLSRCIIEVVARVCNRLDGRHL